MNRCKTTSPAQYNSHPRGGRMHTQWPVTRSNPHPAPRLHVPIRAHAHATASSLQERTDQLTAYKMIDAHMQSSLLPQQHGTNHSNSAPSAARLASTLASQRNVDKNVDSAFHVYGDRVKTDLRHFSQVCIELVRQEQLEKEKWRSFCAMAVKQRDDARARLDCLASNSPPALPQNALKREREAPREDHVDAPQASRSSSPQSASYSGYSSTPPPYSAESNDPHTPIRTRSAPPFGVPPAINGADGPPPKRRRSYDFSGAPSSSSGTPTSSALPRHIIPSAACRNPTSAPALPSDFPHVDLMYAKENGSLVCRACTFAPMKVHSANTTQVKPKAFPLSASWDELRAHCRAHPDECMEIARLHPAEIFELRRRLNFT